MKKRGQLKIQEMAFVLVGIVIFFAMVALVYFSIRFSGLREEATLQREEETMALARKLANVPEFSWAGCAGCIDADKALALKEIKNYTKFWNLDYLMIKFIYPAKPNVECSKANYPDCSTMIIINATKDFGTAATAYITLCRYEADKGGYVKCELGKVYAAAKAIA